MISRKINDVSVKFEVLQSLFLIEFFVLLGIFTSCNIMRRPLRK